jgi:hypothetical protein
MDPLLPNPGIAYAYTFTGERSFESGPGVKNWIAAEPTLGCGRPVAAGVGSRLRVGSGGMVGPGVRVIASVGSGGMVSVMVASEMRVTASVGEASRVGEIISEVGELVAYSRSVTVGRVVTGTTGVRVGNGEGFVVAGTQAVRMMSRLQVR